MKVAVSLVLSALIIVSLITVFGDNVRRLSGHSADALAGDDHIGHEPLR